MVELRSVRRLLVAGAVSALLSLGAFGIAPAGAETHNTCNITQPASIDGSTPTQIEFVNRTNRSLDVYWLDYNGNPVYYYTLAARSSYVQQTYYTHPWIVRNGSACIGYTIAPVHSYIITSLTGR